MVDFAIDIGQTQARIRVLTDGGENREIEVAGFAYGSDLLATIAQIVEQSASQLSLDAVDGVAVGSTGLYGQVPSLGGLVERLHRTVHTKRVIVADDAVTAYLGALGDTDGVAIAAGTGLVGFAQGPGGAARVDGVGSMIGDDGSGWWIGRRGLIAALSAADGRRNSSRVMLDRLESRFGSATGFPALVASSPSPVAIVASFAKDVADAAREGDAVARGIWYEAGDHLASAVVAAASRAGLGTSPRWSLIGRLSAADDLLREGLDARLHADLPGASRTSPIGEPLDGVNLLLSPHRDYAPMVGASSIDG